MQEKSESVLIEALSNTPAADRALDALIALEVDPERFKKLKLDVDSDLKSLAGIFAALGSKLTKQHIGLSCRGCY